MLQNILTPPRAVCEIGHMETRQADARILLKNKLEEAKLRNPNWSLRAFAMKLGMSSGALSEILAGKRPLSVKTRRRIVERLQLSPLEQRELLAAEIEPYIKSKQDDVLELSSDAFHLISDWWHFAILNLTATAGFKAEPGWIATRLGMSRTTVKEAWLRLFRLGYLSKSPTGRIQRKHPKTKTSDDVMNLSIRRAHMEDLTLIEKALLDVAVGEREVTSVTIPVKLKDIPRAKVLIRKFLNEFCDLIESDSADDVYRLSIAYYPLTARKSGAAKETL